MAFLVEDGTGVTGANSYVTTADADTILDDHAYREKWRCLSTREQERALQIATTWLEKHFRWFGVAYSPSDQTLGFPRTILVDRNGVTIAAGTIPDQLKEAETLVALELTKTGTINEGVDALTPSVEGKEVRSFTVETLSVDFQVGDQKSGDREWAGQRLPEIELCLLSLGQFRQIADTREALQR